MRAFRDISHDTLLYTQYDYRKKQQQQQRKKKLKVIHSRHSFIKDTKQTKCNRTFSITIRRPKIPTNNSHFRRSVFFLYNVPQYKIHWLYHDVCTLCV